MIKILKKIFGGIEMTWVRVFLFSVATAVLTAALLLIPAFADSPLREMGVFVDWWFIFAIFVISNCKKPLEAGLKCFVFFLISQPLIYLLQQPFASVNLIRFYYKRWFILTLFTFPGGFLAFYIRRKEIWSALILAVAGAYIGMNGIRKTVEAVLDGNAAYIVDGVFFMAVAVLFGFIFCSGKKRRVYLTILLVCIVGCGGFFVHRNLSFAVSEYDIAQEGKWQVQSGAFNHVAVDMADDDTLRIEHRRSGSGEFTVENEDGDRISYTVTVERGEVTLTQGQ